MSTQYALANFSHLLSKFISPRDRVTLLSVLYLKNNPDSPPHKCFLLLLLPNKAEEMQSER